MLDRLMIRCDSNEDEKLSWQELDCATPLLLELSIQVVNSGLLQLDPVLYDSLRLLLPQLQKPGIPTILAKLLLVNGHLKQLDSHLDLKDLISELPLIELVPDLLRLIKNESDKDLVKKVDSELRKSNLYTTPTKILTLLESIIRRAQP
jgi:hypothetical protein